MATLVVLSSHLDYKHLVVLSAEAQNYRLT